MIDEVSLHVALEKANGNICGVEDALTEPNGAADALFAFCLMSMALLGLVLGRSKVNGFEKAGYRGVVAT